MKFIYFNATSVCLVYGLHCSRRGRTPTTGELTAHSPLPEVGCEFTTSGEIVCEFTTFGAEGVNLLFAFSPMWVEIRKFSGVAVMNIFPLGHTQRKC